MPFEITPDIFVERDAQGISRHLEHVRSPYTAATAGLPQATPSQIATQYVRDVADIYGVPHEWLAGLEPPVGSAPPPPDGLFLAAESRAAGLVVFTFVQHRFGLPIWEAGIAVNVLLSPIRVTSSRSTLHLVVEGNAPDPAAKFAGERVTPAILAQLLGVRNVRPAITATRLLVYLYRSRDRVDFAGQDVRAKERTIGSRPVLPIPTVPRVIQEARHYVVTEVLFSLQTPGWGVLNWRVFIETRSGVVLYLRAAVSSCTGMVYLADPITSTGNAADTATAGAATLDPLRQTVTLDGLVSANPQLLQGAFVSVVGDAAHIAPSEPNPPCAFTGASYSVPSSNFAAVNCYYHLDELYRTLQSWGYSPITNFFTQTTFPVTAYFQSEAPNVNGHANGNATFTALTNYTFGNEDPGATVGFTVDWRLVMHEFNHHVLYDRIHYPDYGFAHNGGDAFGAIWMDPDSLAPDRGLNFPWCPTIPRRHDRDVAAGWAWGGTMDDGAGGYQAEEILSTCLVRLYRSVGGDAIDVNTRRLASRFALYVKIHADASLGPAPITPTPTAVPYATGLMNADASVTNFMGNPGGALGKVIRWSFEKQGLYQPAGAPTPVASPGAPPAVDVYIDDGRHGEYPYTPDFWENTDIWNRQAADGGLTHKTPLLSVTNYVYVRLHNRGGQQANNVIVNAYHCKPSTGLLWPSDWQAMTTPQLMVPGGVPAGGSVIVGPFEWTPTVAGHECLLVYANATGDISNADALSGLPCATGPTPHWWLVPFDNNIGQRNVAPVAGGGGISGLTASLKGRRFWANNPYDRTAQIELQAVLPEFLSERGWRIGFVSPGGAKFTLGPLANREVVLSIEPGRDFTPRDVPNQVREAMIKVRTLLDGTIVGGMSYQVDPALRRPPREVPRRDGRKASEEIAEQLLDSIGVPSREVESVRLRKVIVEIEIEDEADTEDDE